jgi:hypothetical protein
MATVDPDDDSIRSFIVQHYRYDPERRERRNVTVAAFDDEGEFEAAAASMGADLKARQSSGEADTRESISGVIHNPGDRARARNQRMLMKALEHGVWPPGWDRNNPPEGVTFVSAGGPDEDE